MDSKIPQYRRIAQWGIIAAVFGIGVSGSWLISWYRCHAGAPVDVSVVREKGGYTYINPLLFCKTGENKEFSEYHLLKDKVTALIENEKSQGHTSRVSVYYRDLDAGRWFGINENDKYSPASLFKVPIMIAYYKLAESQPDVLNKVIPYSGGGASQQTGITPSETIQAGGSYRVESLIEKMIVFSDNASAHLLFSNIDQRSLAEVFTDLGLPESLNEDPNGVISAKAYSLFFRVLYNGTYLSRELSEKALALLDQDAFQGGIAAGVPRDVKTADKFGDRFFPGATDLANAWELHDCGIVYHPQHPYLLCVMTAGKDSSLLTGVISSISQLIYQETSPH